MPFLALLLVTERVAAFSPDDELMKKLDLKIQKLKSQQQKLNDEIKALSKERNDQILGVLESIPPGDVDTFTLIGGLLHVIEKAKTNDKLKGDWHAAGEKFCKRTSKRSSSTNRSEAA